MSAIVNMYDLVQGLARVKVSASRDEARPILMSVLIKADAEKQQITLACTNGFHLSQYVMSAKVDTSFRKTAPVELFKFMDARKLKYFPLQMILDPERLNDAGAYPAYEQVIPDNEPVFKCEVPADVITGILRMHKTFRNGINVLYWSITSSGHVLEVHRDGVVSRDQYKLSSPEQQPALVCVELHFIAEIMSAARAEPTLELAYRSKNSALVFTAEEGRAQWVLMPMHAGEDHKIREVEL